MRKGFDGLSALVEHQMKGDPLSGDLYLFVNRDPSAGEGVAVGRDRAVCLQQAAGGGSVCLLVA